jgi:hypothetical protein
VAQDADLIRAACSTAGEDERQLAVVRRAMRERGEAIAGFDGHA